MVERSQSFDIQDKSYDEIQVIIENLLKEKFSFSIETKRLGNSLFRITYFNSGLDQKQQKDNRITILREPERRVYIQVRGELQDNQIRQLWEDFEKQLTNSIYIEKIKKVKASKEDIIQEIKHLIDLKGYSVQDNDIQTFLENFIKKFNRLPNEDEYDSIVKGYIIMMGEDSLIKNKNFQVKTDSVKETEESVLDIIDEKIPSESFNNNVLVVQESIERRKCPSCGDETSVHEVIDKSIILMDYPRIYGKKKYCGLCGFEWK
ncbi:MAG: hypothetical protein ACFFDF_04735 [Candidatus Odinarchaeota archaeon]